MLCRLFFPLLAVLSLLNGQSPEPFRFIAMGDTGSGSSAQQRVSDQMWQWMQSHPFQLALMLGDNIYGNTEITGGGNPRYFHEKFDLQYERLREKGVVFHASIGNHDMQTNHAQGEIDDKRRFGILGPDGYYTFNSPAQYNVKGKPLVAFFALNSELKGDKMTQQVEWLKEQLGKSDAVWKVVFLHHPLYTVRGQHAPALVLRGLIEDSLRQNHVQLILAGHNHFYARMRPLDGEVQVIAGGGGRHLAFPLNDKCAAITARKYHFLSVDVLPDKVRVVAIDEYGKVFDDAAIDPLYLQQTTLGCPAR